MNTAIFLKKKNSLLCPHATLQLVSRVSGEERLHLGIQRLSLRGFASDRAEAFDSELLACLLACITPLLQRAGGKPLLGSGGGLLAHDLAGLALHHIRLRQAALRLLFGSAEDRRSRTLALGDLADFHGLFLHGFLLHGFPC